MTLETDYKNIIRAMNKLNEPNVDAIDISAFRIKADSKLLIYILKNDKKLELIGNRLSKISDDTLKQNKLDYIKRLTDNIKENKKRISFLHTAISNDYKQIEIKRKEL